MVSIKMTRIIPYAIVLAVSGYLYYVAAHFDFVARPGRLGPDVWPKALLVLMMAACVYEIVRGLFFAKDEEEDVEGLLEILEEESAADHPGEVAGEAEKTYPHLLVTGVALTVAYVVLFDVLGFFLDTFLYMALFMVVGRYRRPGVILASSLLGSLSFMFVFMKIVYVSLPIGVVPFSGVSLLLMRLMGVH